MSFSRSWHWAVGLMSGTSVDGIDAALVRIRLRPLEIKLKAFVTVPYGPELRERVLRMAERRFASSKAVTKLDRELGEEFAKAVRRVCRKGGVPVKRLAWIGSHGHTIFHSRKKTVQIADPSMIAARSGVTTVADFRQADMAAGGLGAPLTPYFNYHYFKKRGQAVIFLNVGGIANVSYLPKSGSAAKVIGFDTGPGNMVIDAVVRELTKDRATYDRHGRMAAKGKVDEALLSRFMKHPFIQQRPPKACGREQYGEKYVRRWIAAARKKRLRMNDIIATTTALTARSVAQNCRRFLFRKGKPGELIVGGGGSKNKTLMKMLANEFPELKVISSDKRGLPADAAEAVAFAFLAGESLAGRPSNLPSVTGAKRAVVLGQVIRP